MSHWTDERLDPGVRAELLLRELTVEEKCHQLVARMPWSLVKPDGSEVELGTPPPGHVAQLILDDPARLAGMVGLIQHQIVRRSRLGIPAIFHAEAIAGFLNGGHMVFPSGTGLAAGWSPELVEQMTDLIRRQMRRTGMVHALSPVLDVALDPRWGRVHETFGEDPYLCAALGVAYVRGLQGRDLAEGVIATGKHFLGYAAPSGGLNTAAFESGARRTRELFAYPFEAAVQLAGLRSIMNSYGAVDGVPAAASPEVLQHLLRDTLGFDGFISSDYSSVENLVEHQRVAADAAAAGRLAIRAGLDVEMPNPFGYGDVLAAEVAQGRVDVREVDRCVHRVLRAKFETGLFENPYPAERIDVAAAAGEGGDLSLALARRSIVLAQNDGLLPLRPGLDVAVIGPHADAPSRQFPTYTYASWREANEAIMRGELGTMNGAEDTVKDWYETLFTSFDPNALAPSLAAAIGAHARVVRSEPGCALTHDLDDAALDRARSAACAADVVVLALGGASLWFTGERTEGENSDTADIALPAAQARLASAIAATGKPLVVVLVQGRPYALPRDVLDAAAIVVAPYAGPFGTRSIAEVLFGVVNPSGKLPYSVPRHSGQIPVHHHQMAGSGYRSPLPVGVAQHYLDMPATPTWPFGHGLSYTTFDLTDLTVSPTIDTAGTANVSATVTNTGDRDGAAVVQLYLRVNALGVTRPAQQLAGFARAELAPGQSRRLTFRVDATQLGCADLAGDFAVEPAGIDVFLGLDAHDRRLAGRFELIGQRRVLASAERSFLSEVLME